MTPAITLAGDHYHRLAGQAHEKGHALIVVQRSPTGHRYAACVHCKHALWVIANTRTVLHTAMAEPCPAEPIYQQALAVVQQRG